LVEVMMAACILTFVGLGLLTILIKAYDLVGLTRYHDDARAVLQTFASQFERLQTSDLDSSGSAQDRLFFQLSDTYTAKGLLWDSTSTSDVTNVNLDSLSNEKGGTSPKNSDDTLGLQVEIGGSQSGVIAHVWHMVQQVSDDGSTGSAVSVSSAGEMLLGTFKITYTLNGLEHTQSISVLRAAP
jgi:hypothetical protein